MGIYTTHLFFPAAFFDERSFLNYMSSYRKSTLFRLLLWVWGTLLLGMLTAFSGWFHPGCLVASPEYYAPNPPGLPCLPTPPPSGTGETPADSTSSGSQAPIRLTISNGSERPFSITLTGPETYIFNVASGETRVFIVTRGVYTFDMMLCAVGAQGAMNLTKMSKLQFASCSNAKLVEVRIENQTAEAASVTLSGPGNFVLALPAGDARLLTIPRGTYTVMQTACGATATGTFEARSHRTLKLACP